MRLTYAVLGLLCLVCACAPAINQGPIQPPVPIPKRKAVDRSEFPPPPRDRRPPPSAGEEETPPRGTVPAEPPGAAPAPPAPDEGIVEGPGPEPPSAPAPRASTATGGEGPAEGIHSLRQPELLGSVLWVQTSEEYRIAALQAYRSARMNLDEALADPSWDALSEEAPVAETTRSSAVILDVDETVLDNSPYEGNLVTRGPSSEGFRRWCLTAASEAVPGALEFTRYAASRGVEVFYITNRNHELEEATRTNLERLGFPLGEPGEDRILSRYERREWASDKTSRRREVARDHRVLLLVGDDLNDFVSGGRGSRELRARLFRETAGHWGKDWILLPNPMYGSWDRALTWGAGDDMTPEGKLRLKLQALETAP